jgi:hypothetical protein
MATACYPIALAISKNFRPQIVRLGAFFQARGLREKL